MKNASASSIVSAKMLCLFRSLNPFNRDRKWKGLLCLGCGVLRRTLKLTGDRENGIRLESRFNESMQHLYDVVQDQHAVLNDLRKSHLLISKETAQDSSKRPHKEQSGYSLQHSQTVMSYDTQLESFCLSQQDCSPSCYCSCHRSAYWSSPFNKILGNVFVGYSGVPSIVKSCNSTWCSRGRESSSLALTYQFPPWLLARVINFRFRSSLSQQLHFSVQVQSVVDSQDPFLIAIKHGDDDAVRSTISKCPSRVYDIDKNGRDALQVCFRSDICQ